MSISLLNLFGFCLIFGHYVRDKLSTLAFVCFLLLTDGCSTRDYPHIREQKKWLGVRGCMVFWSQIWKNFQWLRLAMGEKIAWFWRMFVFHVLGGLFIFSIWCAVAFVFVHDSLGPNAGNSPQPISTNNLQDHWCRYFLLRPGWINSQCAAGMHALSQGRSPVATHGIQGFLSNFWAPKKSSRSHRGKIVEMLYIKRCFRLARIFRFLVYWCLSWKMLVVVRRCDWVWLLVAICKINHHDIFMLFLVK